MNKNKAELIGVIDYLSGRYYVYRAPGAPGDLQEHYYGYSKVPGVVPYCAYSSVRSLTMAAGMGRVVLKPVPPQT